MSGGVGGVTGAIPSPRPDRPLSNTNALGATRRSEAKPRSRGTCRSRAKSDNATRPPPWRAARLAPAQADTVCRTCRSRGKSDTLLLLSLHYGNGMDIDTYRRHGLHRNLPGTLEPVAAEQEQTNPDAGKAQRSIEYDNAIRRIAVGDALVASHAGGPRTAATWATARPLGAIGSPPTREKHGEQRYWPLQPRWRCPRPGACIPPAGWFEIARFVQRAGKPHE